MGGALSSGFGGAAGRIIAGGTRILAGQQTPAFYYPLGTVDPRNGGIDFLPPGSLAYSDNRQLFLCVSNTGEWVELGGPAEGTWRIENIATGAGSHAYLEIKTNNAASDPHIRFTTTGTDWYAGPDASDSQTFKIGTGTAVGTAALLTLNTSGDLNVGISEAGVTATAAIRLGAYSDNDCAFVLRQKTSNVETVLSASGEGYFGTATTHNLNLLSNNAVRFTVTSDGFWKVATGSIAANNAQVVTVGNVGPGGAGVAIRKWWQLQDNLGGTFYVPMFGV